MTPRFAAGVRLHHDVARGRWVVMAPERMFVPDETALEVLRMVDGARDLDAIIDALAEKFDAPREVIAGDVRALLDDLVVRGALVT
ncbi:pyrroloquinoline quinone biosynthesis peptide chaperone PqqD [Roseomonas sp. PWR1]|uniref:Pyrroloquinoline quinone biosynthesis peptide chaperone PqqD n=1 Tax=Roseomonas nitratireducens TaxID=2820810 RepID=A0ABS4ASD7_9PROT|nr:pyrroloquinoline quinone biosynthesis peptide chaperone PqqD [Neoroseomonas nitratireducens]MBP0464268.1 pyrroloquinoline quinone biosynthesis peptide chaperone PqqD [Neoroseomonas nitratireducens]